MPIFIFASWLSAAEADLKLLTQLSMTLNFGSSGFYLSSAGILSIHHVPDSNACGLEKMGSTFTFMSEADGLNELL